MGRKTKEALSIETKFNRNRDPIKQNKKSIHHHSLATTVRVQPVMNTILKSNIEINIINMRENKG